jgi:hypothetical protein
MPPVIERRWWEERKIDAPDILLPGRSSPPKNQNVTKKAIGPKADQS